MLTTSTEKTIVNAKIAYFGGLLRNKLVEDLHGSLVNIDYPENFHEYMDQQSIITLPDVILMEVDENPDCYNQVKYLKEHLLFRGIIVILLGVNESKEWRKRALSLKLNDYYTYPFPLEDLYARINFLVKFKLIKPNLVALTAVMDETYQMPITKRFFDIIVSGIALIVLFPLFLIIGIIIKLGSKGQIIYKSKRVGAGYKVFDFYKFRSMRSDADKMLAEMADLNQYANENEKGKKSAFVKFNNDPRITRFGSFIRKTSIDELPQLINVFIGDMSLVGNRPLPLYEAEQLTTNKWAERFNGPAGLTGLWQISKRGQKDMSESERKELDNYYARNYSWFLDMTIILKTFPALIQKESV